MFQFHRRIRTTATPLALSLLVLAACGADEQAPDAARTIASAPADTAPDPGAADGETDDSDPGDSSVAPDDESSPYPGVPVRPPAMPDQPAEIVERLVEAERTLRDPATPDSEASEAAHVAQYAYRVLAAQPDWDDEVAGLVPDDLALSLEANVGARRELRGMHTHLVETLPAWRIVDPPDFDELMGHYLAAEEAYGVPWEYLAAIHLVETAIGRVDGVSVAGAMGPMQFMPGTWDAFGEGDVHDHADAIMAAARYLNHSGAPGDMTAALFSYNRHYNYVRAIEHYASVMREDPSAFRGYYHWQVYILTVEGEVVMPVGYDEDERIPVEDHLARLG